MADETVARKAISLIDHTSLGLDDTEDKIRALLDSAVELQPHTAAVCIYPKFVKMIRSLQEAQPERYPRTLRVCTVVNFPSGKEPVDKVVEDTKTAVQDGADEIDVVIDYNLMKEDQQKGRAAAEALVTAVRSACPAGSVVLKVIIESGELASEELIIAASEAAIAGGCDFVKTSTGKVKVNATPEAARVMLKTIAARRGNRTIGFKAAGGVKDVNASKQYLELAAEALLGDKSRFAEIDKQLLRFGASSLLPALRCCIGGGKKRKLEGPESSSSSPEEKIARKAAGLIDHTSLGLEDTEDMIRKLVDAAVEQEPHTAAVCIYPKFVRLVRSLQKDQPERYPRTLKVCTVVNFPGGKEPVDKVVEDTKRAVQDGADEIDVVIDYNLMKEDEQKGRAAAEALVQAVRSACPADSVVLKVIIESGELASEGLITAASEAAIAGGCDFVKTSTGKVKVNATPEAAAIMLKTIAARRGARTIGFKAAGGVRNVAQSLQYMELAAAALIGDKSRWPELEPRLLRFGASSLLPALRGCIGSNKAQKVEAAPGGY